MPYQALGLVAMRGKCWLWTTGKPDEAHLPSTACCARMDVPTRLVLTQAKAVSGPAGYFGDMQAPRYLVVENQII